MEDLKRRKPKPGVFVFDALFNNDDTNLVERVRQSMRENLKREVTELEAKNYIKICNAITKARHSAYTVSPQQEQKKAFHSGKFRLDDFAADNGKKKNLRDWCFYWELVKDGRVMASAGDIYDGFKEIRHAFYNSRLDDRKQIDGIVQGLRNSLRDSGIIASTRFDYAGSSKGQMPSYYATLIHHYNCQYKTAKNESRIEVPHFSPVDIVSAAKLPKGEKFLQALLCTQDTPRNMAEVFAFIAGVQPDSVKIWTPDADGRKKKPHRVASFKLKSSFYIIAATILDAEGQSRGYLL